MPLSPHSRSEAIWLWCVTGLCKSHGENSLPSTKQQCFLAHMSRLATCSCAHGKTVGCDVKRAIAQKAEHDSSLSPGCGFESHWLYLQAYASRANLDASCVVLLVLMPSWFNAFSNCMNFLSRLSCGCAAKTAAILLASSLCRLSSA